jgi:hypothetical protein
MNWLWGSNRLDIWQKLNESSEGAIGKDLMDIYKMHRDGTWIDPEKLEEYVLEIFIF